MICASKFIEEWEPETEGLHEDVTREQAKEISNRHMRDKELLIGQKDQGMLTRRGKRLHGNIEIAEHPLWGSHDDYGNAMQLEPLHPSTAKTELQHT